MTLASRDRHIGRTRVQVKVTPRAKRPEVRIGSDGVWVVKVLEPAEDGRANAAVVEAIADHVGVAKRAVHIVQGFAHRMKLVEILRAEGRDRAGCGRDT